MGRSESRADERLMSGELEGSFTTLPSGLAPSAPQKAVPTIGLWKSPRWGMRASTDGVGLGIG